MIFGENWRKLEKEEGYGFLWVSLSLGK